MSPRRLTALCAAVLIAFALVGGPAAPGGHRARPLPVVALREAAPVAALDPLPTATAGVAAVRAVDAVERDPAPARPAVRGSQPRTPRPPTPARIGRVVALTFDDGPDSRWTPQVLALLARYHAHATFCMIGRQVRTREYLVRAVVARGDTLCNHSFSHDEALATRTPAVILRELRMTDTALGRAAPGAPVAWFRAPGGVWSPRLVPELAATGHVALDWTVDPRDWDKPGVAAIVRSVLAGVRPGAVVDLHDGGGDRSQTVAALRVLLPALAQRGYTFVAVTPALAARTL